ncbi:MAG: (d)CMP kinase [Candidatus Cloacimonadota bacterium]|nr:MAG: (d)CMP kinase [Candidatus Cloacimonadota bacterium]
MKNNYIIAIDGPASSGKSTTAKLVAEHLGYTYIDTGAMYRAVALYCIINNINIDSKDAEFQISKAMSEISLEFRKINSEYHIFLNKEDVSKRIREPDVTALSSPLSAKKILREKMVKLQRDIVKDKGAVIEGRDIGTVVFPNADFKFFLTASLYVRARRRAKQYADEGIKMDIEQIKQNIFIRDSNDSSRKNAPLKKADDAIEIDTSDLTIEQQVDKVIEIIKTKD